MPADVRRRLLSERRSSCPSAASSELRKFALNRAQGTLHRHKTNTQKMVLQSERLSETTPPPDLDAIEPRHFQRQGTTGNHHKPPSTFQHHSTQEILNTIQARQNKKLGVWRNLGRQRFTATARRTKRRAENGKGLPAKNQAGVGRGGPATGPLHLSHRVLCVQLFLRLARPGQVVVAATHWEAVVPDAHDALVLVDDARIRCVCVFFIFCREEVHRRLWENVSFLFAPQHAKQQGRRECSISKSAAPPLLKPCIKGTAGVTLRQRCQWYPRHSTTFDTSFQLTTTATIWHSLDTDLPRPDLGGWVLRSHRAEKRYGHEVVVPHKEISSLSRLAPASRPRHPACCDTSSRRRRPLLP